MTAVYLASGSAGLEWAGLVLALGIIGGISGLLNGRSRRLFLALLVAVGLAYGATVVQAAPYLVWCDGVWKYLNWFAC